MNLIRRTSPIPNSVDGYLYYGHIKDTIMLRSLCVGLNPWPGQVQHKLKIEY